MTRVSPYNFEQYSVMDIKKHVEGLGYKTRIVSFYDTAPSLVILGTTVSIDFIDGFTNILPCIQFRDNLYSLAKIKLTKRHKEQLARDQKFYSSLTRKFRLGNKITTKSIKDWEGLKPLIEKHRRKLLYLKIVYFVTKCIYGPTGVFRAELKVRGLTA